MVLRLLKLTSLLLLLFLAVSVSKPVSAQTCTVGVNSCSGWPGQVCQACNPAQCVIPHIQEIGPDSYFNVNNWCSANCANPYCCEIYYDGITAGYYGLCYQTVGAPTATPTPSGCY